MLFMYLTFIWIYLRIDLHRDLEIKTEDCFNVVTEDKCGESTRHWKIKLSLNKENVKYYIT